ncbi:MAG: hypothetical protein H0T77_03710 [Pyrinomonadaceae bacterium]|jgi:hypothetical protein|nr:hypothetical protein [Pyrinomonadaceae bacterium]
MSIVLRTIALAAMILSIGVRVDAQGVSNARAPVAGNGSAAGPAITAATAPVELARAALSAHGGEKFRNLKSVVLRGSVELYAPNSTQSIPGGFVIVIAGEKARIEVDARPAVSFKMIYDGQRSYSSLPNVDMPPLTKFGLGMLVKFDQTGYAVTGIPDKKKHRGFRITDSDGNITDFYVDPATGRVMSFLIPYGGYTFGTENKKMKEIDAVLIATSFTQRLEMPQGAFFADYNVKDVKLNQPIGDDVFAIP